MGIFGELEWKEGKGKRELGLIYFSEASRERGE